jgi:hypothetical protein
VGEVAAGAFAQPDRLEPEAVRMDHEHLPVPAGEQDPLAVRGRAPRVSAKSGAVILRGLLPSVFTANRAPVSVPGSLFLRKTVLLPPGV